MHILILRTRPAVALLCRNNSVQQVKPCHDKHIGHME